MSRDPAVQIFFDEAYELLAAIEQGVLGLERAPEDTELLNSVFRAAHTIKGNSGMLGYERIAHFTHALEELLTRLRAGEIGVTAVVVNTLLAASDVLRELMNQARDGGDVDLARLADVTASLAALSSGQRSATDGAAPASAATEARAAATRLTVGPAPLGPRTLYEIRFAPTGSVLRRGLDATRIFEAVTSLGEVLRVDRDPSGLPPLDEVQPELSYVAFKCWIITRAPRAEIEGCFDFVDEPEAVRIDALEVGERPAAAAGAAGVETALIAGRDAALPATESATARARGGADADMQSIRVATEKVDHLVNLVGELVITQSMVAQLIDGFTPDRLARLREAVDQMDRHSRDLQERVMAVRMLPIRTVFGRFSRVVRDLAQSLGKRVQFSTSGGETEVDKTVIERISDPLTHLVRNAVDHGLEGPAQRAAAGKPETGRLTLSAYQAGGNIYIEIQDDGRGLDRDRILAKAVDQGLVSATETLTDEQVYGLIVRPGFSTARQVTEVSGRGVGLDVVKRNVEGLGGSISIQSVRGAGATFRVKLPLTLAILEGQLVRVGSEIYALPLVSIMESIRPTRESLTAVLGSGEGVVMRGEVLPLVRLHRLFDVPAAVEDPVQGLTVVVEQDDRRVALLVDELLGQQQVVIKSLEANYQKVEGVAGATILGDGRVALILDVPGLVGLASRRSGGRAA